MEERLRGMQAQIDALTKRNEQVVRELGSREEELRARQRPISSMPGIRRKSPARKISPTVQTKMDTRRTRRETREQNPDQTGGTTGSTAGRRP